VRQQPIKIIAAWFAIFWANETLSDPTVLGAMQAFHEFCMTNYHSIEEIAGVANSRHYHLVVDRLLPGPNNSTLINKTWQVVDSTGDFALTVTQSYGSSPVRSLQCGVTLPRDTETNVESALKNPSNFGAPSGLDQGVDGSRTVRWTQKFDWGTVAVSLSGNIPSLHGGSMLNVLYQTPNGNSQ
jgi:hypothetical protein